ncbi:MAG: ComEA family DNA-binding protein [Terriglobia bacterium]
MKANHMLSVLHGLSAVLFGLFLLVAYTLGAEEVQPKKININTATLEELATLPGIGPKIAERVVRYREKNGAFRKIEELLIIRGISRKKFEKIGRLISVEGKTAEKPKETKERKPD